MRSSTQVRQRANWLKSELTRIWGHRGSGWEDGRGGKGSSLGHIDVEVSMAHSGEMTRNSETFKGEQWASQDFRWAGGPSSLDVYKTTGSVLFP